MKNLSVSTTGKPLTYCEIFRYAQYDKASQISHFLLLTFRLIGQNSEIFAIDNTLAGSCFNNKKNHLLHQARGDYKYGLKMVYYLNSTNDLPVISAGFASPIRSSTVGATSARIPSLTAATLSETTTIGTGLSE